MKDLSKIVLYIVASITLGCLLAPPLYVAGRYAVEQHWLPQIGRFGFTKYFNRSVLIAAVLLLWPFLRWAKIRTLVDLKLQPNPKRIKHLLQGLTIAIVGLLSVGFVSLLMKQTRFQSFSWASILSALLTAITVATIEELFFRGALLGMLRRKLPDKAAQWLLSAFFAILHFLKPRPKIQIDPDHWYSGFLVARHIFWQFEQWQLVLANFVTLFLVGYILGYTVIKTRSLYFALGLHAGWVFALRSFDFMTKNIKPNNLWLGPNLITGVLPLILLIGTFIIVKTTLKNQKNKQ